jgi:nicotinate-nucleotide pyrophosphorylase (carboxylating)
LSGIATITNYFVNALKGYKAKIYDTRKTIPGLRLLAKYAVACGGGSNHRMNLSSMAIIKDNHLKFVKNLSESIKEFRQKHKGIMVEVECENIEQVKHALMAKADLIMLDNMSMTDINAAAEQIRKLSNVEYKPEIEISGGINKENVEQIKYLDVDRISIGFLTHSAQALDMSLEITIS